VRYYCAQKTRAGRPTLSLRPPNTQALCKFSMKKHIFFLVILIAPSISYGCSCGLPAGTHKQQLKNEFYNSELIFSGYVSRAYFKESAQGRVRVVEMVVLQSWKGELVPEQKVEVLSHDGDGASCLLIAEVGEAYMVYSSQFEYIPLSRCSMSSKLYEATTDIPYLNKLSAKIKK
jgi:hypothetical protein